MANHLQNKKYLDFVRTLPCCHTGGPAEPHHIIGVGMGMMGGKAPDICTMPLSREVHEAVHKEPHEWPQVKWMIETQIKAIKAGVL